jgi:outer membrane protein, heavy metal efflux system
LAGALPLTLRHIVKRSLFVILGVILVGCVAYKPAPISPTQTENAFRARSIDDPGLRNFVAKSAPNLASDWPPQEFNLEALTLVAFYFHPDIQLARARVAETIAAETTAGERPNPSVAVAPQYTINPDVGSSPWLMVFDWDIPIETAGKRKLRMEQTKQLTIAARLALGETAWKVRADLRSNLVEFYAAELDTQYLRTQTNLRSNLLTRLERQLQAGEASRLEVNVARSELIASSIALAKAETHLADARYQLAASVGLPMSAFEKLRIHWHYDEPPKPQTVSQATVQTAGVLNRLDVRRSLAEYAASEAALHGEVAKQIPDVHLSPNYEYDQGQHKFGISATATLPIFNNNGGAITEAEARRKQAEIRFLSVQSAAIQDSERALAAFQRAYMQWTNDSTLIAAQTRNLKSAEATVQAGEADQSTVWIAQLQRLDARRGQLESLRVLQQALGALENAVQRPIAEPNDVAVLSAFEVAEKKNKHE